MDGDFVLDNGCLSLCLPMFAADLELHAVTTDEDVVVDGPSWMQSWLSMRFAQRRLAMQSHALSNRILTLIGRFSVLRATHIVSHEFIRLQEADYLDNWLWRRLPFPFRRRQEQLVRTATAQRKDALRTRRTRLHDRDHRRQRVHATHRPSSSFPTQRQNSGGLLSNATSPFTSSIWPVSIPARSTTPPTRTSPGSSKIDRAAQCMRGPIVDLHAICSSRPTAEYG